ncbi:MAG: hypothetical protein AVDCRST_MAG20-2260, partial [uncultured Acidimicrobiales bacterium]
WSSGACSCAARPLAPTTGSPSAPSGCSPTAPTRAAGCGWSPSRRSTPPAAPARSGHPTSASAMRSSRASCPGSRRSLRCSRPSPTPTPRSTRTVRPSCRSSSGSGCGGSRTTCCRTRSRSGPSRRGRSGG